MLLTSLEVGVPLPGACHVFLDQSGVNALKMTNLSTAFAGAAIAAAAIVAGAPMALAEDGGVTTASLGSQAKLDNGAQGWTVTDLKPSTDTINYQTRGTLWEVTATNEALEGSVTPIVSNFNIRAADGKNYRALFQVATPDGVNPATLAQGQKTSGKIYFDVTGEQPTEVVYNAGGRDLLVWDKPAAPAAAPAAGAPKRPAPAAAPAAAPSPAAAAPAAAAPGAAPAAVTPAPAATPAGTGAGSRATDLPAATPAGTAATPAAAPGTEGVPAAAPGAPAPEAVAPGAPAPESSPVAHGTPVSEGAPAPAATGAGNAATAVPPAEGVPADGVPAAPAPGAPEAPAAPAPGAEPALVPAGTSPAVTTPAPAPAVAPASNHGTAS